MAIVSRRGSQRHRCKRGLKFAHARLRPSPPPRAESPAIGPIPPFRIPLRLPANPVAFGSECCLYITEADDLPGKHREPFGRRGGIGMQAFGERRAEIAVLRECGEHKIGGSVNEVELVQLGSGPIELIEVQVQAVDVEPFRTARSNGMRSIARFHHVRDEPGQRSDPRCTGFAQLLSRVARLELHHEHREAEC